MSRLRDNAKLRQAFTDWKDGGGDIWTVLDELDRALASPSPGAGGGETPGNALKEHCAIRLSGRHCPLHGELPAVPAAEPGKPATATPHVCSQGCSHSLPKTRHP